MSYPQERQEQLACHALWQAAARVDHVDRAVLEEFLDVLDCEWHTWSEDALGVCPLRWGWPRWVAARRRWEGPCM